MNFGLSKPESKVKSATCLGVCFHDIIEIYCCSLLPPVLWSLMCSTNCLILVRSEVVQTLLATGQTGAVRTGLRTIFSLHTLLATELYLGVLGSKEECKQKKYNFYV